jgi:hypothetical protein
MLNILSALVTVFALQAHASDSQILGKWISEDPILHNGPLTVKVGFDFKGETADMSTICYYPSRELEAVVTVAVEITEGKIKVLNGGNRKIDERGMECIGSVDPGVVDYSIDGEVLRVSAAGQYMNFVRR